MTKDRVVPFTLGIDIGGTHIKMMIADANQHPISPYKQAPTPSPAEYQVVIPVIANIINSFTIRFDRVAAGFPGVVKKGKIKTAPNMDPSWVGIDFQKVLEQMTGVPVLVANDAVIQGYGDIEGRGIEMVITLGTGMGAVVFVDGAPLPLELGHHPFKNNLSYEQVLGKKALEEYGLIAWKKALWEAINLWERIFNYDRLYIGGGFAHLIDMPLPANVQLSENVKGVLGGVALWNSYFYTNKS